MGDEDERSGALHHLALAPFRRSETSLWTLASKTIRCHPMPLLHMYVFACPSARNEELPRILDTPPTSTRRLHIPHSTSYDAGVTHDSGGYSAWITLCARSPIPTPPKPTKRMRRVCALPPPLSSSSSLPPSSFFPLLTIFFPLNSSFGDHKGQILVVLDDACLLCIGIRMNGDWGRRRPLPCF
jgi:hypothetical protein